MPHPPYSANGLYFKDCTFLFPPILSYGILSEKEKTDNADPQNLLLFLIGINKKLLVMRIQLTNDYNLWIYHQMVQTP